MAVSFNGRVEALVNVPSGVSVSASNSGGGATSVSLTEGSYFWSDARTVTSLSDHIASQLNTTRAPSSGTWTVAVSASTGLCSIGCTGTTAIPSFSLAWTSTALRDVLGFERDIDYAQTAAHMAADLGYGDFTNGVGYLCNEASGNLSPVFGSGTLTAANTPTYGTTGPRGGTDKAVGFSGTTSKFTAASSSVLDIGTTDDFLFVWVGKFSAAPTVFGAMFSKAEASFAHGWAISGTDGTQFVFDLQGSGSRIVSNLGANYLAGEWHVGIAARDCAAGTMRVGIRSISSGTQYLGTNTTCPADSYSSTASFSIGDGSWVHANTEFQCAYVAAVAGTGVAAGVPANIGTALTTWAATFSTRTGTKQCRGLWLPDCVLNFSESYAKAAPTKSDMRSSQSPDGTLLSLVGNTWLEHASASWKFVPKARTWEAEASPANSSWEFFFRGTQLGLDSTGWFDPSSPILIVDHAGSVVGINANSGAGTDGWQIRGLSDIAPKVSPEFAGTDLRWVIELPALVSSG